MVARPFFMTLPGYPGRMDEKELLNDLEYLQQTYPGEVRRCQRRIAEILDKYDYEDMRESMSAGSVRLSAEVWN